MLKIRIATAIVGLPIIVLLIVAGGWWYAAAVAAILLIATLEFQAPRGGWLRPLALVAAITSAAIAIMAHAIDDDWTDWWIAGALLLPFLAVILFSRTPQTLPDWLWAVAGIAYIGWLGSHIVLLRDLSDGRDLVFFAVLSTFATDTSAYFVGQAFGRRRLAPAISPGKTVEGAIGGVVFGFAAALLLNYFLGLRLEAALVLPLALLLPIAAQLGDLLESKLKRTMAIKDAGALLPGHGGLMDRLDSVLLTILVVYYYVRWVVL